MKVGNPIIARRQREFAAAVQAAQPRRPLLVQVLSPEDQTRVDWVPMTAAPPGELWTRTIALNEVVFDFDSSDWARVRFEADRVCAVLDQIGAPYLLSMTGGKGVHIHVWLDAQSVRMDNAVLDRAERVDVCPFSVLRETFANGVLDAADVPRAARWSKDGGVIDWLKVHWSSKRMGSMIREFGCAGSRGFRKTLVDSLPAALERQPLRMPDGPTPAFRVAFPMVQRFQRTLREHVEAVESARQARPTDLAGMRLEDVPCVRRAMEHGVGRGNRHAAHLNLVVTAFRMGYTADEATEALASAVEKHGLSEGDTIEKLVGQVYTGRWRAPANLTCPSPMGGGFCNPNECCLSRSSFFS